MGKFDFFNQESHTTKKKAGKDKQDFRAKILSLLEQIKQHNEARHQELQQIFKKNFDSPNLSKKRVMGFYGQLRNELRDLTSSLQDKFTPVKAAENGLTPPAANAQKTTPATTVAAATKSDQSPKSGTVKKAAKKVTKAPAKKVAKKASKAAASTTKATKKTAKKVAKKASATSASSSAKKTTKVSKATPKKKVAKKK